MTKKRLLSLWLPFAIILIAVAIRLLPHPPNFSPIGAIALFGGAYLCKRYTFLFPILAMFISDIILGFHSTMPWVYGSFLLISLLGIALRNKVTITYWATASLGSSLLFFVITNFGVWFQTQMYPKTVEGLILCYTMAIPFFRNTLLSDLIYSGLFFGAYQIINIYLLKRAYLSLSKSD